MPIYEIEKGTLINKINTKPYEIKQFTDIEISAEHSKAIMYKELNIMSKISTIDIIEYWPELYEIIYRFKLIGRDGKYSIISDIKIDPIEHYIRTISMINNYNISLADVANQEVTVDKIYNGNNSLNTPSFSIDDLSYGKFNLLVFIQNVDFSDIINTIEKKLLPNGNVIIELPNKINAFISSIIYLISCIFKNSFVYIPEICGITQHKIFLIGNNLDVEIENIKIGKAPIYSVKHYPKKYLRSIEKIYKEISDKANSLDCDINNWYSNYWIIPL